MNTNFKIDEAIKALKSGKASLASFSDRMNLRLTYKLRGRDMKKIYALAQSHAKNN